MTLPLDYDLIGFVWTTAKVLLTTKPHLRKNSVPMPVRYHREVVDDPSLTEPQKKYLAPLDQQLLKLNYRPLCTYRVTNYGKNLLRYYHNPADPASCALTIVEVRVNVKGVIAVKNSHSFNFTTRFSSGKWLTTRNMSLKTLMDNPDYRIIQECRHVTDLTQLKKRHEARAASLGVPLSPPNSVEAVFTEGDTEHERFLAHQLQRGILRPNAQGDAYLPTDRAYNRGIRNHYNPFARRLSIPVALFSILIGAVLPLFGILKLAPLAAEFGSGPLIVSPSWLAVAVCYAIAGLILGLVADTHHYVWVMIITYIPAHLVAGTSLGWFPYSTLAFAVSYFVCQAKRKRQLVLQS